MGRLSHQNPETAATPTCADVEVPQSRVRLSEAAQLLKEGRKLIFNQFLHFEEKEAGFRWSPDLPKSRGTEEGLQQSLWFPKPSVQEGEGFKLTESRFRLDIRKKNPYWERIFPLTWAKLGHGAVVPLLGPPVCPCPWQNPPALPVLAAPICTNKAKSSLLNPTSLSGSCHEFTGISVKLV